MAPDPETAFRIIGWLGQGFYFVRFLVQWLASERARRIVVPVLFWWMSLAGGLCMLAFTLLWDEDLIMVAGAAIPLFIYPRNLVLLRTGRPLRGGLLLAVALGIVAFTGFVIWRDLLHGKFAELPPLWMAVGGAGQALWVSRFPLQWWISERRGRSVLPRSFFAVSLAGSVLLLAYAIHRREPIYIAGQVLTPFLNARNLWLGRARGAAAAAQT